MGRGGGSNMTSHESRPWTEEGFPKLRARLTSPRVIRALGIDPDKWLCPRCHSRVEIAEGSGFGLSLRRTNTRCRIGRLGWLWPEHLAAELWNTPTIGIAVERLDAGVRSQDHVPPVRHL